MDDNREQAQENADECKVALTDELDTYTFSRFRPSASGRSGRFLATNRKAFHRRQMRLIVNDYFNKEEGDGPTVPLSQQPSFPNQSLPRSLAEYHELVKKKTEECKAALIDELDTYIQSRFRSSATGHSARFYVNLQSFHREQMLLIIDEYFNSEEDDLPTFPSNTVHSVNQVNVASNQEAAQVDTTPASQPISPVTPNDQQHLAKSGEAQVKEEPVEEDSSTRPREVDNSNTIKNIVNVSTTGQHQSNSKADADCGCDDCLANKGRVQADSVLISPECDNSDAPPTDANGSIKNEHESECESDSESESDLEDDKVDLSAARHGSEMTNNEEIDEAINSLLNQETHQVEENVAQMQTDAQQQAPVPTAVNSNNEQVDNSVNSNFENLNESQAMDFNEDAVDEQADSQPLLDEAFVDEPFPTVDLVSLPSTSSGRRSTRSKNIVNYANAVEDSDDEYSTVNRNGKRTIPLAGKLSNHKRVAVEQVVTDSEEDEDEDEEEEVGVEAVRLSVIVHHLNCTEAGCTEKFPDKAQLKGHLLSKHQIMEFQCKVKDCALSFATQSELTDHHKSAHRHLKDWPCAQCETTCKSYSQLSSHFGDCHEEGEFLCSADKCTFTGKTHLQVRNHKRNHSSVKYECTFAGCTKSFTTKSNLTIHLRTHNQEMPFACEECPKAFTTKEQLTVHKRTHSGLKPYHCKWPGCDYSACTRSNVAVHVRVHHFGLPGTKKEQAKRRIIDTRDEREFIEKIPTN